MLIFFTLLSNSFASEITTISLYPGFVTKLECTGKLVASSVGSQELIELEAIPSQMGCALLLKPRRLSGLTNLVVETSAGSKMVLLQIIDSKKLPSLSELKVGM